MSRGLIGGGGRGSGLRLDDRVASYLGVALLALVVAAILVTFVLLLVRRSPTPTAVELARPRAHVVPDVVGPRSTVQRLATG
jgi:hypothetical protein